MTCENCAAKMRSATFGGMDLYLCDTCNRRERHHGDGRVEVRYHGLLPHLAEGWARARVLL